jgi:hypothetical protein
MREIGPMAHPTRPAASIIDPMRAQSTSAQRTPAGEEARRPSRKLDCSEAPDDDSARAPVSRAAPPGRGGRQARR